MLISCRQVKKSFGDTVILDGADLDVGRGDRIGLVGRNGSGKTTLANILAGCLEYDEGSLLTARDPIHIGYLRQTELEPEPSIINRLDGQKESLGEFQRLVSHMGIPKVQDWSQERWQNLSGGEKTKLALARVWASRPDLIILDEPTNHLDIYSHEALEESLIRFPGTIMIISHDRYLLQEVCQHLLVFDQQKVSRIEGRLESYLTKKPFAIDSLESQTPADLANEEELLLLETKIAWVLGELNRIKPDTSDYMPLDQEYTQLVRPKKELRPTRT